MGKKVYKSISGLLLVLCMFICLLFVVGRETANAAPEGDVIWVNNGNGAYLRKDNDAWYYFNSNDQIITDIQYIEVMPNEEITSGFYMFASDGRMIQEEVLYNFKKRTVAGVLFQGYHITDKNGCFTKEECGLRYFTTVKYKTGVKKLNKYYYQNTYGRLSIGKTGLRYMQATKVGNKAFSAGYYYFNQHGRLFTTTGMRYLQSTTIEGKTFKTGYYYFTTNGRLYTKACTRRITKRTVNGKTFSTGYYYFDSNGRLYQTKRFKTVKKTINGVKFDGVYYFGGNNAQILCKAGWITYKNNRYYIDKTGKRASNCWKDGYYLLEDGTIAKNMQVPDGSYVNWRGEKCTQNKMNFTQLKTNVQKVVSKYSGNWSVYVKDLESGNVLDLNNIAMYPASTIKAFVMASTYDQINKGNISYTSTIKSYLKSMITVSDNEAYNQLVKRQTNSLDFKKGFAVVNQYLKDNNYKNTACHTTLSPSYTGYRSDGLGSNKASAKDCGVLLEKIYKGTCVSNAYSKEMLNLLLAQERTWKIPYALPKGVKTANKTGETSTVQHDMAIVYGAKTDYIICVFASNVSEYYGIKGIQEISKEVYNFLN